jgi:hypothetical protein
MTRNPPGARQNLGEEEISEMAVDKSTAFVEDHVFFHFFPIKDVFAPIIFQYVTRLGVFSECIYGRLKIANSPQLRVKKINKKACERFNINNSNRDRTCGGSESQQPWWRRDDPGNHDEHGSPRGW